ncbi:MAG: hypothetical protein J6Y08_01280 [Clostridiales bacterium]|nr:hypothetical protein [Clostridiales bacterium]
MKNTTIKEKTHLKNTFKKILSVALTLTLLSSASGAGNENNEAILALVKVLQGPKVKAFIEEKYDGAVVPLH